MMNPYIKKYEPKKISDIIGQDEPINKLYDFIISYRKQKKKSALVYGPSGVGKTSSVYAIANDKNFEVIEVNASDFRNKQKINDTVGNALKQGSLFGRQKIVLVDEVDGISGTKDRGAITEIIKLMKESTFPLILTAQNPFDNKFSTLRNNSELIAFKELDYKSIFTVLKNICEQEKIKYEDNYIKSLSRMAGGDLRSAINDMEGISDGKIITKDDITTLAQRDKDESMLSALVKVLKNTNPVIAKHAFDNVKEDIDQRFLWLDKNMPREYENPQDKAQAYYYLTRADVFRRRIRRRQHWRFLVYVNALMSAGISVSKEKKYEKFLKYEPTGRLLKIFWANRKLDRKKKISARIALQTHSSSKRVFDNFEYYKLIFRKEKHFQKVFTEEFDLDKDDVAFMKK